MPFVNKFHEIIFHLIGRLLLFLTIFFSSFNQMKISLVALEKEFISEVDTVFISTNLMKSVHIELMI